MTAPFTDAHWTEVQVRVAYALIKLDYKHNRSRYRVPSQGLARLAGRVHALGLGNLSTFILAWAVQVDAGTLTLKDVVAASLKRARDGHTFRRVAYDAYKASRRPDPRVTNRGVKPRVVFYGDIELGFSTSGREVSSDD